MSSLDFLLTLALQLTIVLGFVLCLWVLRLAKIDYKHLLVFALIWIVYCFFVGFGNALLRQIFHSQLHWNWYGKLSAFVVGLLIVWFMKRVYPKIQLSDIGLTLRQNKGSVLPSLLLVLAVVGLNSIGKFPRIYDDVSAETYAFQAIVPGLDEELFFRGILLYFLSRAIIAREFKFLSAPFHWGCFIQAILFGLVHGLFVSNGQISLNWEPILLTGIAGLIFTWIRQKTGSLVMSVFAHNVLNFLGLFFRG